MTASAVYIVAAGNNDGDACDRTPARIPNVITVAATNKKDRRWEPWFSAGGLNFGDCVEIFAPSKEIRSACVGSNNNSCELTGTSMAAPHVPGAAALRMQLAAGSQAAIAAVWQAAIAAVWQAA